MTTGHLIRLCSAMGIRLSAEPDGSLGYERRAGEVPKWLLKLLSGSKADILRLLTAPGTLSEPEVRQVPGGTLRGPRLYGELPSEDREMQPPTGRSVFERMTRHGW